MCRKFILVIRNPYTTQEFSVRALPSQIYRYVNHTSVPQKKFFRIKFRTTVSISEFGEGDRRKSILFFGGNAITAERVFSSPRGGEGEDTKVCKREKSSPFSVSIALR